MAKIDYNAWQQYSNIQSSNDNKSKLNFLQLKNSGDFAIVRFVETGADSYDIGAIHVLGKENKYKRVSCLRNPYEPLENCPLCENGEKVMMRMYVKLIHYVDENGEIVEKPSLWERPAGFAKQLNSLIEEYGDLKDCLFKIVRNGSGLDTTYDVLYAPNSKYPSANYPTTTIHEFDNFSAFGRLVKEYSFEQMQELASGKKVDQFSQSKYDGVNQAYAKESKEDDAVANTPTMGDYTISNQVKEESPQYVHSQMVNQTIDAQQPQPTEQRQRRPWEVPTNDDESASRPRRRY